MMLFQNGGWFIQIVLLLCAMFGIMSTLRETEVVTEAAVAPAVVAVVDKSKNTKSYVDNVQWYPYGDNDVDTDGNEQLPRILQAGSYVSSSNNNSSSDFADNDDDNVNECADFNEECDEMGLLMVLGWIFLAFFGTVGIGVYVFLNYCNSLGGPNEEAGTPRQSRTTFGMTVDDDDDDCVGFGTNEQVGS